MTNTPRAVVFDLGKVLLDFDYGIAARKLISNGKLKLTELARLFSSPADVLLRYETGLMTTPEFYSQICALTGYARSLEEFSSCFGDIFTPIPEMVGAHSAIRSRGIPTYIFSNTNELAIEHIRREYPFFENFDGYILSYEHRAMKPDQALYEVVERVSGLGGSDILYIDDRPENIDTGKARGWQVILQENPAKTLAQLRKFGTPGWFTSETPPPSEGLKP
jgi:2-haloacid dehalogenase